MKDILVKLVWVWEIPRCRRDPRYMGCYREGIFKRRALFAIH